MMKKLFLFFAFLLFSASSILACAFCGCGNSNFQIGILPTFSKAFVSVRYSYSHFKTDSSSQFSRDYFHTTELWGGYNFGKFQVMTFVPYLTIHKLSDDGDVNSSGLGDITVLGNYQVFSKTKNGAETKSAITNILWLGGGIKLPTGLSTVNVSNLSFTVGDFSATPGTGSTDYIINAMHNLMTGNNGLVTNVAYRVNTVNLQQFQYGNRIYLSTAYFHSYAAGSVIIRPTLGVNLVVNKANHYQGLEVAGSSGYLLNGMAGVNLQKGKVGLLLNAFLPLSQDFYHGLTQFKERESVALSYSF
jgi:hypothetical protein